MEKKALIEAGRIVNTHGVQGEVKIEVWLDGWIRRSFSKASSALCSIPARS